MLAYGLHPSALRSALGRPGGVEQLQLAAIAAERQRAAAEICEAIRPPRKRDPADAPDVRPRPQRRVQAREVADRARFAARVREIRAVGAGRTDPHEAHDAAVIAAAAQRRLELPCLRTLRDLEHW